MPVDILTLDLPDVGSKPLKPPETKIQDIAEEEEDEMVGVIETNHSKNAVFFNTIFSILNFSFSKILTINSLYYT